MGFSIRHATAFLHRNNKELPHKKPHKNQKKKHFKNSHKLCKVIRDLPMVTWSQTHTMEF